MSESSDIKTYYITKWALTEGIIEREGRPNVGYGAAPGCVVCYDKRWMNGWQLFHDKDVHETLVEAKARVIEMAKAKIRSAQKSIAKMQSIIEEMEK